MGNSERDLQFWRQCPPQGVSYMRGYENTYGVYGYANGCYFQGNGSGHGYGNGWSGHGIGHMYGHGNGIAFHNQIEDYKNIRSLISSLNEKQRQTVGKLDELHLHLKKDSDEKSKKDTELQALLKSYEDVSKENKELLAENSKLTEELAELKHNESAEEKAVLRQENVKLEDAFVNIKDDLSKARQDANALKVLNEKLLKSNEEQEKTISHYRKKLANYTLKGRWSDCDSMLERNSIVTINGREAKQTRRIGLRALHALTSLGAENTMGPWFCIACGTIESPLQFLTYPEYRRHLIEVDGKTIDPSLCKLCGLRCTTPGMMQAHLDTNH